MKRSLLASLALLSALALPTRAQDVPVVVVTIPSTTISTVINLTAPMQTFVPVYSTETLAIRVSPGQLVELRPTPTIYPNVTNVVWYKNGKPLSATTSTLSIPSATTDDSGNYYANFTSDGRPQQVGFIQLLVGDASALITRAVSLRAYVDPAKPAAVAGFVISAQAGSSADNLKPVLVRVIGPSLSRFGVAQPLATPRITLYRADGTVVPETSRIPASDTPTAAVAAARAGAFPLESGTADVAFVRYLPAGVYTAQVTSASAAAGEVLIEIYEFN